MVFRESFEVTRAIVKFMFLKEKGDLLENALTFEKETSQARELGLLLVELMLTQKSYFSSRTIRLGFLTL